MNPTSFLSEPVNWETSKFEVYISTKYDFSDIQNIFEWVYYTFADYIRINKTNFRTKLIETRSLSKLDLLKFR
jgi:hypothetical protein